MASLNSEIVINNERRLCTVNDEPGYFHCWEHYSTVVDPSPMIGGSPGGTVSYVNAIVETKDGVIRVPATSIKFCDEENAILAECEKNRKEVTK
jgi:hypothetical protein